MGHSGTLDEGYGTTVESAPRRGWMELQPGTFRISGQRNRAEDLEDEMTLRLSGEGRIHNFRNYPHETVAELRALLASGAPALPDPRRKGFYDLEGGARKFYVHVAPDGSVWLLASWLERRPAAVETPACLAACL
jgi:hypothetical protein